MAATPKQPLPYQSVLENRPRYTRAIGMITVELSNLDVILGELLAAILAINVKFGRAIYLAPYASSARLSILGNVSEAIFKEKSPALLKINNIIGRARGSHTRRDELIHAAWGLVKKRVHKRNLPLKDTRPSTPVELAHLTLLIRDIRVLITETFSLAQEKGGIAQCPVYQLRIGRSSTEPYFVDNAGTAYVFKHQSLIKATAMCKSCGEALSRVRRTCSWCRIRHHHKVEAASRNSLRMLAQYGLLEEYISGMDNIARSHRRK